MSKKPTSFSTVISIGIIILFAVVLRLIPHPANVAPIAALALFGGVYLDKKIAFIIPLAAMIVSDLFLGFHASMAAVYGSFFITVGIGLWVRQHKTVFSIIGASVLSSVIFFILTNFNYWYVDALYPKTLGGLVMSYTNALPFFRNTIIGDLFYTGIFFGAYELLTAYIFVRVLSRTQKSKVPMSV